MLVLQGIWVYGALWLWAEDSGRPPRAAPRPGRPSRAPRPHPFACDVSLLADALSELAEPVADLARKAVEDELTLFLPSTTGGPVASPDLIRPGAGDAGQERRPSARRPVLTGWRIPALTFESAAALRLLTALGQPALREPVLPEPARGDRAHGDQAQGDLGGAGGGLAVAGSVPYLAALARLADDLAARGRVRRSSPRRTRAMPHGGGRCSPGPMPSEQPNSRRPCRRSAGPPARLVSRPPGWSPMRWRNFPMPPPGPASPGCPCGQDAGAAGPVPRWPTAGCRP